ncbi:patatin-like phospholipase family protein [Flaviaesturariibacter flavus]|uniref:Patatin-like phospholipase family protein n=1 Tax=Flaviaesturariibacter flavus TaxID=2502780 RepID=A0A4V2NVD5_9BACT|nr:patatin-like phospholipase family protein [Flaviaesturariibacter flavus]
MAYLRGIFYSLPVQLLFLHFRKYQVLLLFWLLLFAVVGGAFMKTFGAEALFLAPEYLGDVNALSTMLVGAAMGVFIMCWNITTFILFSRHFTFLAATQFPFLKYCINNSALPLGFLIFFFFRAYSFAHYRELIPNGEILLLILGFVGGLLLILVVSFLYFFRADKTILRGLQPLFKKAGNVIAQLQPEQAPTGGRTLIRSEWFLDSLLRVRRCRDVSHYSAELMEKIFKRHHFAAVLSMVFAFLFLVALGFFLDLPAFQLPAAASLMLFCAILIGVSGAFAYFFQSWSAPILIAFLLLLNVLYQNEWIDPRNRAYGLNYANRDERPKYSAESLSALATPAAVQADRDNMIAILERWKARQGEEKPLLILVATSGGGTRSATFTMNVLQHLDSITGGAMMKKTFLITGASGGMIGATYFRELYRRHLTDSTINLHDARWVDDIARDLLNPTFTSFVIRDLFSPQHKFTDGRYTYIKDRGYAFEQALNRNTRGYLDRRLGDYRADEAAARIPLIFYHNVITRDAKKLLISTQPLRFMMTAPSDSLDAGSPDAVDFLSYFRQQDPYNLHLLSALRMNATFPVVLPNVMIPTDPVTDVMDGGLRDNYGVETALRFLAAMHGWIEKNTRGALLVQVRDRMDGGWENPYDASTMTENAVKPFFLLQHNWYKMMDYAQGDMASYFLGTSRFPIHRVSFQYIPNKQENKAALNFHLTKREKLDIAGSINSEANQHSVARMLGLMAPEKER